MTYLGETLFEGGNVNMAHANFSNKGNRPHNASQGHIGTRRRKVAALVTGDIVRRPADETDHYREQMNFHRNQESTVSGSEVLWEIDKIVAEGRQKDLAGFFGTRENVPKRVGDWELRVNTRRQDNVVVGHTVVALPLTVRARKIFEQGCMATLKNAGYSDEDAVRYYKAAWRKKYVWVESVLLAVKEMIEAFKNTHVLDSYEVEGDPRRLAHTVCVPKNPYLTSHDHFLVAVNMAKCVIRARQAAEASAESEQTTKNDVVVI